MTFSSFELLVMKSMQPTQSLFYSYCLQASWAIYCTAFLIEFPEFLSDLVVIADNILIVGDFNTHIEKSTDPLLKAFGHHRPTHCHSHNLDLVLSL